LAAGLVGGALNELSSAERQQHITELTERFVLAVTAAIGEGTDQHIGPALARQTAQVLRANLEILLSDEVRHDSAAYVSAVTHAFSSSLIASLSNAMEQRGAPAISRSLEQQMIPAFARGIDQELRPVLAKTSREMAREASLGVADALSGELGDAIDKRFFGRVDGLLDQGQEAAGKLQGYLKLAVVFLVLLLAGAGVALYFVVRMLKKRTRALTLVAHAVKQHTRQTADRGVVDRIKVEGKQGPGRRSLNEFLAAHPDLIA
jgi:hypothetical protein